MRILQVIPYFYPAQAFGGPVQFAFLTSKFLMERGHEVSIFTSDALDLNSRVPYPSLASINGVKVYYFKNWLMSTAKHLKLFLTPQLPAKWAISASDFDIVHLHEYRTFQNIVSHFFAEKFEIPYVLQAHGSLPRLVEKFALKKVYDVLFGKRLLSDLKYAIALTKMEQDQYAERGVPSHKIAVIPNGVDPALFQQALKAGKGIFKKHFGVEKKRIILYLGRLHPIKGLETLVKAFAKLVQNSNFTNCILVIVGPDDGYLPTLVTLIKQLGLQKKIIVAGPLYGKAKIHAYIDADVYVLPSQYETFPSVLLEAAMCSTPIVASNIKSITEILTHKLNALLFEEGNELDLKNQLAYALQNPEFATALGYKAKEHVQRNFTIEKITDKLELLYKRGVQ